jgi:hypothetical protein
MSTCGTDRGYQAHRTHEEKPCDACREAHNRTEQVRRLRREDWKGCRNRPEHIALYRLAARHRLEFRTLYGEELERDLGMSHVHVDYPAVPA